MSCITLTTDFGLTDPFVGIMKGVIASRAPLVPVIDLTHGVAPQDVLGGALAILQAIPYFPDRSVHVVVVDPGVGGPRTPICIETDRALLVGPDNGVLSLAAAPDAVRRVVTLTETRFHLLPRSATFHGRDVFAPVAAALATGTPLESLGPRISTFERLTLPEPVEHPHELEGEVIHVDHFGNLTTNLSAARVLAFPNADVAVRIGPRTAKIVGSYQELGRGHLGAVMNSWGFLEITTRDGSAATDLAAHRGTPVSVRWVARDG